MQEFICPRCGFTSTYDPMAGAARCLRCGYSPLDPSDGVPRRVPRLWHHHEQYLDELVAHWNGTYQADDDACLPPESLLDDLFHGYQLALGERPKLALNGRVLYVRSHHVKTRDAATLMAAYVRLRMGHTGVAERMLRDLVARAKRFADAWVWLSAVTQNPDERLDCMEKAFILEPGHPLARDGLAVLQGRVDPDRLRQQGAPREAIVLTDCPNCGAPLARVPVGGDEVRCDYCGYQVERQAGLPVRPRPVSDVHLTRHYEGQRWDIATQVVRCQSCAAELVMLGRIAHTCPYCGSTNVLFRDPRRALEQPDGVVPFQLTAPQAALAVTQAGKRGWRGFVNWLTGAKRQVSTLRAVWTPFWAFDVLVEIRTQVITLGSLSRESGYQTVSVEKTPFRNRLGRAAAALSPAVVDGLTPFGLDKAIPYAPHLLADCTVALPDRDVEFASSEVCLTLVAKVREQRESVEKLEEVQVWFAGPDEERGIQQSHRSYQAVGVTYRLLLLPLYVGTVGGSRDRATVWVNGQTGKVAFAQPQRER